VEGYVEAIATGLMAGIHAAANWPPARRRAAGARDRAGLAVPLHFRRRPGNYQPANITFDLLPQLDEPTRLALRRDKPARHAEVCRRARAGFEPNGPCRCPLGGSRQPAQKGES
jgi:methylenetetrahydrofolate--tRNA-(uracil-5-)-methyltransferase